MDIYLNYGDSILGVGDQVTVVREGREIVDRDTGKVLGSKRQVLGELEIVSTNSNFHAKQSGASFDAVWRSGKNLPHGE